jgi:glycosyltransferase involved in cell wall biosynthesis
MGPIKKILYVGGEDAHLRIPTMEKLRNCGYELAMAAPTYSEKFVEAGFPVFHYRLRREVGPRADLRTMHDLRQIVEEWRPDVVHSFDTKPSFLVPIALRNTPGPAVLRTITGMGKIFSSSGAGNYILRKIYDLLHGLARKRTDFTIFQNETDQAYFVERGFVDSKEYMLIAGSGIDVSDFDRFRNDDTRLAKRTELGVGSSHVFAMISRLVEQKGVIEFSKAARLVRANHSDARFLLIGPSGGDEPDGISEQEIAEYSDCVDYLGTRSDVPEILNAIDVFVLPTKYREGVPRSMLEAMAMGRPVIVTEVPGCIDAVRGRNNGFLVPPGDAGALAAAMLDTMSEDLAKLGTNGRQVIAAHYSLAKVIEQLQLVYGDLLVAKERKN